MKDKYIKLSDITKAFDALGIDMRLEAKYGLWTRFETDDKGECVEVESGLSGSGLQLVLYRALAEKAELSLANEEDSQ